MTALQLIVHDIPAIRVEQTGKEAFHMLNDFHVNHLPVVAGKTLVGILSEEDIFNHKLSDPLSIYDSNLFRRYAVRAEEHVFEVIKVMGEHRLTVIPVIDAEGNYLGLITQNELLRFFSNTASFTENGAVIVLEMNQRDFSMATVARIIEDEDVKILSAFVTTSQNDPEIVELTLKLNRNELGRAIASLERHDYTLKESFGGLEYLDNLKERYDSLMNYLNV